MSESGPSGSKVRVTFDEPQRPSASAHAPPAYGDDSTTSLALPVNRLSESSRSDGSSGEHGVYASTTTTTHTVHTTTTFFRLPRRKKNAPLFDLSHLPQKTQSHDAMAPPRISASSSHLGDSLRGPSTDEVHTGQVSPQHASSPSTLVKASSAFAATPGVPLVRQGSTTSSTHSSPTRRRLGMRGRSSTLSSLRNANPDDPLPTPPLPSGRTSTSTGRKSFGDLFSMSHRLRQNSDLRGSGLATPGSSTSKNNSIQLTREATIVLPERHDDDTPAKYLVRLEEVVSRGVVASVLSKGTDQFSQAVLRSYMRGFGFFGDPMDMAIRKLLMEVELPKETQQIDRCLQGFANRYHECNPGIYDSPDQAYFIAFSLLILHTDVFNKNNKHKMQKPDYLKNTRGEGIFDEILECFYDNISYTPFIHVEDDLDINGERILPHKMKKKSKFGTPDSKKPSKEPVDPYTLIIDSKLDTLRPNLKDVMSLEEHYSYLGTATSLNMQDLQKTFFKTGVLQIVSARSRPDAFMSEKTATNTDEAQAGIVDIKITKVGLLWRKDVKKKKTRSPWQEWGAILTGAQLYFFRNVDWIKKLMSQHENHIKQGHDGIPVIFKPPLDQFKPDALMSTDDAVALLDSTYKKHKNAFVFVRHGGFEETFLADNESEMNDWLAKLNYAAAFRTSGVRMRGVVGGNYDGQRSRGIRRLDSHTGRSEGSKSVQTPTGEVTITSGRIDRKMADDILAARREIMLQKIGEAETKLVAAQKQLDAQLRNARHLQILAPIHAKTRDQVVHAAGRMSAQLKWGRMEIWRLKCHKEILTLDLEEERNTLERMQTSSEFASPEKSVLGRLHSKASSIKEHISPKSPTHSMGARRPSTATQHTQQSLDQGVEDVFYSPPPLTHTSSYHKAQATWELPPLQTNTSPPQSANTQAGLPLLDHRESRNSVKTTATEPERATSPTIDAAEYAVLAQQGYPEEDEKKKKGKATAVGSDVMDDKEQSGSKDKDKLERGKIRRSLHRTLRDAHVPSHARSRKGKDSSSSAGLVDEAKDDVLARGTGSFVVHGKKASVITFGTELASMSPDERLRLKRQSRKDDGEGLSPTSIDDFHSLLVEPVEYHGRHGSTTSTATAKSFRQLHARVASSSSRPAGVSDGEDSDAVTFSDGRRTPLPPADEDDENEDSRNDKGKQSIFFTPEDSRTPVTPTFPPVVTQSTLADNEEDDIIATGQSGQPTAEKPVLA